MRYWEGAKPKRVARRKRVVKPRRSIATGGSFRQYPFLRTFYQHQATISGGIQKFLFFLVIATLLYAFVFGDAGVIRVLSLHKEKTALAQQVAELDANITELEADIERIKTDPFMMEKLGREKYGLVYPGDRVYKIIHPVK